MDIGTALSSGKYITSGFGNYVGHSAIAIGEGYIGSNLNEFPSNLAIGIGIIVEWDTAPSEYVEKTPYYLNGPVLYFESNALRQDMNLILDAVCSDVFVGRLEFTSTAIVF